MANPEIEPFAIPMFPEERREEDHPARMLMVFEPHKSTGDIIYMASQIANDARLVFRKGERNIMWMECGKYGKQMQELSDLSVEKTGSILGGFAFMHHAMILDRDLLFAPMTDDQRSKLKDLHFCEEDVQRYGGQIIALADLKKDYATAKIMAADHLAAMGYDVKVVYEDTDSAEPDPVQYGSVSFKQLKKLAEVQVEREGEMIRQWKSIADAATSQNPVNMLVHLGSAHNLIAEKASGLGDVASCFIESDNANPYPNIFKEPWRKVRQGEYVSPDELLIANIQDAVQSLRLKDVLRD